MRYVRLLVEWIVVNRNKVLLFLSFGFSLYALSFILMHLFIVELKLSNTLGYAYQTIITYLLQFTLNALFTWSDRAKTRYHNLLRIAPYLFIKVILWAISQGVNYAWVGLGLHFQIANAITVLIMMTINFGVFELLIFPKKKGKEF